MKSPIQQCALLLMAFTVCTEPALAVGNYLNCQTKKAIIIDAPNGKSSLSTEENLGFWTAKEQRRRLRSTLSLLPRSTLDGARDEAGAEARAAFRYWIRPFRVVGISILCQFCDKARP
jgi:hypothetical protein